MNHRILTLLLIALATTFSMLAVAHAGLERTLPVAGSVVREPPPRVTLWFSQRLEPAFSTVRVLSSNGERVDDGDARIDATDARMFSVSLRKLSPGTYRVRWRVLSVDTHVVEGDFTFDVGP